MNKIIIIFLIGVTLSFISYGALAPSMDVSLVFLGFFTDKDMFGSMGSNFDCECVNQFPGVPSTGTCLLQSEIADPDLKQYGIDASGSNICT